MRQAFAVAIFKGTEELSNENVALTGAFVEYEFPTQFTGTAFTEDLTGIDLAMWQRSFVRIRSCRYKSRSRVSINKRAEVIQTLQPIADVDPGTFDPTPLWQITAKGEYWYTDDNTFSTMLTPYYAGIVLIAQMNTGTLNSLHAVVRARSDAIDGNYGTLVITIKQGETNLNNDIFPLTGEFQDYDLDSFY